MCLSIVDKICKPLLKEERYAYKVFRSFIYEDTFGYAFDMRTLRNSVEVPTALWLKAEGRVPLWSEDGLTRYPCGFHCFTSRKGALAWNKGCGGCVVRVRVRGIKAFGIQRGYRALIAREMLVPPRRQRREK